MHLCNHDGNNRCTSAATIVITFSIRHIMNLDRLWFRSPPDLVPDESRSDLIWIYTGFGFEKTTHLHVHTKLIRCLLRYMEAKIIKGIVFSLLQVIHIHCLHQFINHKIILGRGQKTIHLRLRQWQNNLNRQKGSLQKTILRGTIDNVKNPDYLFLISQDFMEARVALTQPEITSTQIRHHTYEKLFMCTGFMFDLATTASEFFAMNDDVEKRQPERKAIMRWLKQIRFTASATLHGKFDNLPLECKHGYAVRFH
ncbi:hypothetical protein L2E82_29601 [Cichorium intybus]|uniref:Uncharacterized protein n=1 Tax=Cichorium intybus TaxID=13427 RepID=A0ACB9CY14_CICIN|nr:hypothetical protein L2E82_29601 [Cichorium intybus]